MNPARLTALCALIADDACQRATPVPYGDSAERAGYVWDERSARARRILLDWMAARRAERAA